MLQRRLYRFVHLPTLALIVGCVSTPYSAQTPYQMTDAQIFSELDSVYAQLGVAATGLSSLRSLMPPPAPVITANSLTVFYASVQPIGDSFYVSGTATTTTRYDVYDQNATARAINQLAQTIQQSRIMSLQRRGFAVEAELRRRVREREDKLRAQQARIHEFFQAKPYLLGEKTLLATILPWVRRASDEETLEQLGSEADAVLAGRSGGALSGRWYGVVKYHTQFHPEYAVRADFSIVGETVDIQLRTIGGRTVHFSGHLDSDGAFSGQVWAPYEETKYPDPLTLLLEMTVRGELTPTGTALRAQGGLINTSAELSLGR
jgi:hypothetical protein